MKAMRVDEPRVEEPRVEEPRGEEAPLTEQGGDEHDDPSLPVAHPHGRCAQLMDQVTQLTKDMESLVAKTKALQDALAARIAADHARGEKRARFEEQVTDFMKKHDRTDNHQGKRQKPAESALKNPELGRAVQAIFQKVEPEEGRRPAVMINKDIESAVREYCVRNSIRTLDGTLCADVHDKTIMQAIRDYLGAVSGKDHKIRWLECERRQRYHKNIKMIEL